MKRFLIILFILFVRLSEAQVSSFQIIDKNNNQVATDGAIYYHATKNYGPTITHEFEIKNTSASTLSLSLRKYEDLINTIDAANNDMAQAYFCFGTNCLPSSVFSYSVELAVGESVFLEAKFDEASIAGHSSVRFKFNNKVNTSDALSITLKYDTNVGLNTIEKEDSNFSNPYPSPSSESFNIDLKQTNILIKQISLLNSAAQELSKSDFTIRQNEKGISINTAQLPSGIYFIQIVTDKTITIKKININH